MAGMPLVKSKTGGRLFVVAAYAVAMGVAFAVAAPLWAEHPIWVAAAADLAATVAVFVFSVLLDNASVYDPYWSVAPVMVAGYWGACGAASGKLGLRQAVIVASILLWGVRLTTNWARRWGGPADEDFRYREIRAKTGHAYWPASFVSIHLMPTIWVFLGLLPLYPALTQSARFGVLDGVATALTASAIAIEAVADRQLRRFLRSPHDPGEVLRTGLWARCRHPNYLGDVLFWWGLFLFSVSVQPDWAWTAAGPLSITLLFVFVSVPWMDRHMLARHAGWTEHATRLPALVPLGPSKRGPFGPGRMTIATGWRLVGIVLMLGTVLAGGLFALRYRHSCVANGKRYYSGQGMGSLDGCNMYGCYEGHILGTQMMCLSLNKACKDDKTTAKKAIAWVFKTWHHVVHPKTVTATIEDQLDWEVRMMVWIGDSKDDEEWHLRVRKADCETERILPKYDAGTPGGPNDMVEPSRRARLQTRTDHR
jgi:steroid 5-alpha reductase family enzyme